MKKFNRYFAVLVFSTITLCVHADEPVKPADVVFTAMLIPYLNGESAPADVRAECDWNVTMPRYLIKESEGRVQALPANGDVGGRRTLSLVAQTLHTIGGGGYTGPKWLVVEGRLTQGGQLLGNFEARRQTFGGSMRGCTTLRDLGENIADDILEWLEMPTMNAKLGDAK